MLIKYFYDDKLAQASYLVGCLGSGTAVVIDPARNIQPYLHAAEQHEFKIEFVTETHIHADFVSGTRELAHATGATMLLSDEGGEDWQYQFPDKNIQWLKDGDTFWVGSVKFEVLHTPGHTPEHITLMVTDTDADKPMGLFTGDFIFVGDVGRPDLLEEAAGVAGMGEIGARQQFENIGCFKEMPDYLQIWPGHGAGSACGKALGAVPSTTLGYEKLFNPAFQYDNETEFVEWLLDGQPEAPKYFAHMKKINKQGSTLLSELSEPQPVNTVSPQEFLVIDTRSNENFTNAHIHGTVNIPISSNNFPTYVGWYVDFEEDVYFIADSDKVQDVITTLRAIGVDRIVGYMTSNNLNGAEAKIIQKTPQEIYADDIKILDVRGLEEYNDGHIPNVNHIHMGKVPYHLEELPRDEPLAIQCGGGLRSQIVVSILQKNGFGNVVNMKGGIDAWKRENLPLVQN